MKYKYNHLNSTTALTFKKKKKPKAKQTHAHRQFKTDGWTKFTVNSSAITVSWSRHGWYNSNIITQMKWMALNEMYDSLRPVYIVDSLATRKQGSREASWQAALSKGRQIYRRDRTLGIEPPQRGYKPDLKCGFFTHGLQVKRPSGLVTRGAQLVLITAFFWFCNCAPSFNGTTEIRSTLSVIIDSVMTWGLFGIMVQFIILFIFKWSQYFDCNNQH